MLGVFFIIAVSTLDRLQNAEAECIGESWRNLGVQTKTQKSVTNYTKGEGEKENITKRVKCLDGGITMLKYQQQRFVLYIKI